MKKLNHYQQLDGLRAIAVLLVLMSHWINLPWLQKIHIGIMGVNLFFALSGFLISEKLLIEKNEIQEDKKTLKGTLFNFYTRRFLRIFPIYYLTVFFFFIINWTPTRTYIVYLLTYTTNFITSFSSSIEPLVTFSHTWSLSVEEQYYIVIPILILTVRNIKWLAISFIFTAILSRIVFYFFLDPPMFDNAINFFTTSCFDSFGLGLLLAYYKYSESDLLKSRLQRSTPIFWLIMIVYLIIVVILFFNRTSFVMVFDRFVFSLISIILIGLSCFELNSKFITLLLSHKWMKYIGKISYGIYLYHFFLQKIIAQCLAAIHVKNVFLDMNVFLKFIIYFILTICVASISWYLIELPLNNLKKRFA